MRQFEVLLLIFRLYLVQTHYFSFLRLMLLELQYYSPYLYTITTRAFPLDVSLVTNTFRLG